MFRRLLPAVLLVATLSTAGHTQLNRYATMQEASVFLVGEPKLQSELKITPAQQKSIQEAFGKYANIAMDLQAKYRKDRAHKEKYNAPLKEAQKSLISRVLGLFSSQQKTRLKECGIQHYGILSVTSPDVAKEIKMTPEQSKMALKYYLISFNTMDTLSKERAARIRAIPQPKDTKNKKQVEDYQKKAREVASAGRDAEIAKIKAVQTAMEKKTMDLLTPVQKAAFEKLKGKIVNLK